MRDKVNTKDYRLIELRAENFRKLKAVRIKVDGNVVQVGGRNEQGKSAVLDVVAAAIGGKDAFPPTPVRKGAKDAEIMLNFGGLKLVRKIWNEEDGRIGQRLTFEYADGTKPKQPQAVLDDLRGSPIADDPLEFARLDRKKQFDLLKQLVPDFDFADIAKRRQVLYEERTAVGRDRDRARATAETARRELAANLTDDVDEIPEKVIDVGGLATQLRTAHDTNNAIDRRQEGRDGARQSIEDKRDEADRLLARARTLNEEADALQKKLDEAEPLPAKVDTAALEKKLETAEKSNELIRQAIIMREKASSAEALAKRYDEITGAIVQLDSDKEAAVAAAKLPVPGLSFGDEEIMLDGLPFADASTARKIRVATSLLMALKPDLRVLLVREGSLLDKDSRAALEEAAKANDFVVLMECVGAIDGAGVVIEDGEVVK
jgi:hypothetical protein